MNARNTLKRPKHATRARRTVVRLAAAVALGLGLGLVLAPAASVLTPQTAIALPPDGPSPNTPDTYVEVWPTTVRHGDVLNFRVSGFPAGEVIHLKYDDGDASVCGSSAVHGACVIHTQVVPSSGVTVGSIVIPGDLPVGTHWLRFLASAPAPGGGVLGFTLHGQGGGYGNSTFAVVEGGSAQPGGGGGAPAGAAAPVQTTGQAGSAEATTGAGGTATAVVGEPATTEPQQAPAAPAASGDQLSPAARSAVKAAVDDSNLTLAVNTEYSNEWMYVYAYSKPTGLGWQQVANDGTLRFSVLDLEAGEHRFAVVDEDGTLIGWTAATIEAEVMAKAQELATGVPAQLGGNDAGDTGDTGGVPWLGIGAVAAALVVGGVVVWLVLRRPRSAATPSGTAPVHPEASTPEGVQTGGPTAP